MDIPVMFRAAVAEFDARIRQVGAHQWQAATPDEDWAVRDLINHVAGEDLWAPPLLAGSPTIAEVGDRFDGDVLGADPRAAWAAASAGAVRAVGKQGAMDQIVHLSFGDFPGREYVLQLFADHLIHAWDLARAIGADERLDAGLVAHRATWFETMEDGYRSAGAIAARPPVPDDADAQTVLLARFGLGCTESCCQRYSPRPHSPELGDLLSMSSKRATHGLSRKYSAICKEDFASGSIWP